MPEVRALSGNIAFPGFTAPKLMWLRKHEPQVSDRVAKVLLPKDYLNYWLTGEMRAEMSDAAGSAWLDVGQRVWSDTLLEASGMRREQMPELIEGNGVIGPVAAARAEALGLPEGVKVVGGGADNAAAACGVGALAQGQGFVSLGTSGVLLAARDSYAPDPESAVHTFCHAVPDRWYQMGVVLAATDSLNWLSRILESTPRALTEELGTQIGAPGRLLFLPYLSGERTPHNDSATRGAFLNLDVSTNRADMVRAVLEGVSFALRDCLAALQSTGAGLDRVLAIGGGAQSVYWVELLATVLNLPVDLPERGEFGAALGAARLAICGSTGAHPEEVMRPPPVARTVMPRQELVADYAAAWQRYRRGYPALRSLGAE
jgi:xylulokinase